MLCAACALVGPPAAAAHGPCFCVTPNPARTETLRVDGPAVRVIWNPRPRDFAGQTTPLELASGYRPGAPTATVMRHKRPRWPRVAPSGRDFDVPAGTPPGLYFVLIFDGGEGGSHTTWDYVQVPGRAAGTGGAFGPLVDAVVRAVAPSAGQLAPSESPS